MNEENSTNNTVITNWSPSHVSNVPPWGLWGMSPTIGKLAEALSKAQGQMKAAVKNRVNPHYKSKFADFDACVEAAKVPLSVNSLAVAQPVVVVGTETCLKTILMHSSGEWLASLYPLKPERPGPQQLGSALTYAKRYALSAMILLPTDEDDDGNAASKEFPPPFEEFPFEKLAFKEEWQSKLSASGRFEVKDPSEYVVQIGKKYKGKKLKAIPTKDVSDFMMWLQDQAHKKNEKLSGFAKEFVDVASVYIDELKVKETS